MEGKNTALMFTTIIYYISVKMSSVLENLKQKAKSVPNKTGIYFFINKKREIIYIGRANDLKKRLSQYFLKNIDRKSQEMINEASDLKYQIADTILQSIIIEALNIKKYWPKYNIKEKDNRSFIYLLIEKADFAKILLVREKNLNKYNLKKYDIFGPYQSYSIISKALVLIRKIFPYSLCQANLAKPCFDRQIGLCPGLCTGEINAKDYKKNIRNIKLILTGKKDKLIEKLIIENPQKAKNLKHIQDVSLLKEEYSLMKADFKRIEAYDISHWQGENPYGAMTVALDNIIDKSEYRLFKIKNSFKSDDQRALLEVLKRREKHIEWPKADLLLIDGGKPQISFLEKNLKYKYNLVGLSKYSRDKLIFSSNINDLARKKIKANKKLLLELRDEAHRFANLARKRALKKG